MRMLFIHRAFPAQFGRLALELTQRYGWQCTFVVEHLSTCPAPSPAMREKLAIQCLPAQPSANEQVPWPQSYGKALDRGHAIFKQVRAHPDGQFDLVVGHGGLIPTFFLREALDCPIIDYCEYYFAPRGRDLTYRIDLPAVEPGPFFPRCINAATLVSLVEADVGYCPTEWQQQSFPERLRHKIEVHFDGIDTELYRRREVPRRIGEKDIPAETRVVTFVARGLESIRGFDLFMQLAARLLRERSDLLFVVAGSDQTYYGWDRLFTGQATFKQWVLSKGQYDLSRFLFLGHVSEEQLAELFCLSDLHVYLTVPFVLSWSLFNAMASGVTVLASDVGPVREVITSGRTGLLEPLFDLDRLTATALRVLADPAKHRPLGAAARALIEEKYSVEVAVPALKDFFERTAHRD